MNKKYYSLTHLVFSVLLKLQKVLPMNSVNSDSLKQSAPDILNAFNSISSLTALLALEALQIDSLNFEENKSPSLLLNKKNNPTLDVDFSKINEGFTCIKDGNGDWIRKEVFKEHIRFTRTLHTTLKDYKSAIESLNVLINEGKAQSKDATDLKNKLHDYLDEVELIFENMKITSNGYREKINSSDRKLKKIITDYNAKIANQDKASKIDQLNKEITKLETAWGVEVKKAAAAGFLLTVGVILIIATAPVVLPAIAVGGAMTAATAVFCVGVTVSASSFYFGVTQYGELERSYESMRSKREELRNVRLDVAVLSGLNGIQERVNVYLNNLIEQTDEISKSWKENIKSPVLEMIKNHNSSTRNELILLPSIVDRFIKNLEKNLKSLNNLKFEIPKHKV